MKFETIKTQKVLKFFCLHTLMLMIWSKIFFFLTHRTDHVALLRIWEQNGHYSFIDQNSRIIRNNNLFLLLPFSLLKGYFPKAKQNGRRTEKDLVSYVSPYPPPLILSLARQNMILYSSQRVRIKPVTYSRLGMETFLVLTWWQRSYFNF